LSLALERRVTARLYEFFYKETPEEREREYLGDLLVQPRTTKEIRAYVLADYLLGLHRERSEEAVSASARQMYRSGTAHFDVDGDSSPDRARSSRTSSWRCRHCPATIRIGRRSSS
jgi:hypothetical protein